MLAVLKDTLFNKGFYLITLYALLLGLFGGVVTVGFIEALQAIQTTIWETIPESINVSNTVYVIGACSVGGILVGLANKYLGDHPKGLAESVQEFKQKKHFDYKHIPQAIVASLASLGFGASLGPEAALAAIVGGLGSWIGLKLRASASSLKQTYSGVSKSLVAFFSPIDTGVSPARAWVIVPGVVAAVAGLFVIKQTATGGYLVYDFLPYTFAAGDLWLVVPIALVATAVGLVFIFLSKLLNDWFAVFKTRPIVGSLIGGVLFGVLASLSALMLFSGHEGIQEIIDDVNSQGAGFLFTVAFGKILAASLLLAAGWKGGRFFPLMFAGAAVGLALSDIFSGIPAMVGLATAMSATLAAVLRQPFVAILLLVFIFPANLYAFVAIGALLGAYSVSWFEKKSHLAF